MIRLTFLTKKLLQGTLVASILLFTSCGYDQNSDDTKTVAEEHNDVKFDNNEEERDAQFLVNASEINLEEIQLAQLAQQNGTSAEIKELGRMMEDAHTKSQNDLTALAKSKMISIPTSATDRGQETYNSLNDESDDDFDKAYADMMVSNHKDAIETFEEASTECNDTDIKNWAISTLPVLRTHLNHSIAYQEKIDNM